MPLFERPVRVDTLPAFVRVEAYTSEGQPLVFSNPIYFREEAGEPASAHNRVDCR